jgi:hypothetical protein
MSSGAILAITHAAAIRLAAESERKVAGIEAAVAEPVAGRAPVGLMLECLGHASAKPTAKKAQNLSMDLLPAARAKG